jgi:hydrogenase maturation protease
VVIGLGCADRGDDAVGPVVARAVGALAIPGVLVIEHEDPTGLIDLWAGHDPVVVVDAVRSGQPSGSLHHLETGAGSPRLPAAAWADTGTHAFGVAAMVELARALHRLPDRLVVVGVEAAGFAHGAPLSPPVADAVEAAVALVMAVVAANEAVPD